MRYLVRLDVAGTAWTIICVSTPEFEAAHRTWWPDGVLAVGLMFTAMLAGYLLLSIEHTVHLEKRVRQQTADIRMPRRNCSSVWQRHRSTATKRRGCTFAEQAY